jgi:hypothetical protein
MQYLDSSKISSLVHDACFINSYFVSTGNDISDLTNESARILLKVMKK